MPLGMGRGGRQAGIVAEAGPSLLPDGSTDPCLCAAPAGTSTHSSLFKCRWGVVALRIKHACSCLPNRPPHSRHVSLAALPCCLPCFSSLLPAFLCFPGVVPVCFHYLPTAPYVGRHLGGRAQRKGQRYGAGPAAGPCAAGPAALQPHPARSEIWGGWQVAGGLCAALGAIRRTRKRGARRQ